MRHTAATKAKLSEMRRGERNPFFGKKHTAEFRAAQSARTRAYNAQRQYEILPCRFPRLSSVDAAYLAGIIDGEGSITFPIGRKRHSVQIYNTSRALMEWLWLLHGKPTKPRFPREDAVVKAREPIYCWEIHSARDVFYLLTQVRPFLRIKGSRADEAMAALLEKYGDRIHG